MFNLNTSNKEELFMMLRAMGCSFCIKEVKGRRYLVVGWQAAKDYLNTVITKVQYYFPSCYATSFSRTKITFRLNPKVSI